MNRWDEVFAEQLSDASRAIAHLPRDARGRFAPVDWRAFEILIDLEIAWRRVCWDAEDMCALRLLAAAAAAGRGFQG